LDLFSVVCVQRFLDGCGDQDVGLLLKELEGVGKLNLLGAWEILEGSVLSEVRLGSFDVDAIRIVNG